MSRVRQVAFLLVAVLGLAVVATLVVTRRGDDRVVSQGPAADPLGVAVGRLSGLPWNSGIFPLDRTGSAASYRAALAEAGAARGRPSDIEQAAQWDDSWQALAGVDVLAFMDPGQISVVDLPPFPAGGSWGDAASGAYDEQYRRLGASVVRQRPDRATVLRLGWEFNGSSFSHRADGSFVPGWRRAVTEIRRGAGPDAAKLVFSWSLSGLERSAGYDPLRELWPGDSYVDMVGVDVYDRVPAPTTATDFAQQPVLDTVLAFAKRHGKRMAIEEWGLHNTGDASGGGDNPAFISAMIGWIRANAGDLVYEQYFQDDAPDNVNSSLFSRQRNENPLSRQRYVDELNRAAKA